MIAWAVLAAILLSLGISLLATPLSRRVAVRTGMLDIPHAHKAHANPTPLLGGCAIFAAVVGPALLVLAMASIWAVKGAPAWLPIPAALRIHINGAAAKAPMAMGILAAAAFLHVVGIIDDRKALGPWIKLLAQIAASLFVVLTCKVRILTLAGPTLSIILTTLWLVAITNSFNFLDNMDGLAAGVAMICAAALLGASLSMGQVFVSGLLCLILGATMGFLPYNFAPARTFMGDAGSLVLGFLLGVASCLATYVSPVTQQAIYGFMVPLMVMAVPLYDTTSVMLIRLREGRNPMVGDRRHFSHRLVKRGLSTRAAVMTIWLCTAGTAIGASLLPRVDLAGAMLVFCQTAAILLIIAMLESGDATGLTANRK